MLNTVCRSRCHALGVALLVLLGTLGCTPVQSDPVEVAKAFLESRARRSPDGSIDRWSRLSYVLPALRERPRSENPAYFADDYLQTLAGSYRYANPATYEQSQKRVRVPFGGLDATIAVDEATIGVVRYLNRERSACQVWMSGTMSIHSSAEINFHEVVGTSAVVVMSLHEDRWYVTEIRDFSAPGDE